jgi:hypothetical protein
MFINFPTLEIVRVTVPSALQGFAGQIERIGELALTEIANDAVGFYQQEIVREGSVDTGYFLNTVRVRRAAMHERDIASDAFYSGVVRRKGSGERIGPRFAERTIARLGPSVESAFSRQLMR